MSGSSRSRRLRRIGGLAGTGKFIAVYAIALAAAATALNWLEYRYVARAFSTEFYIALIAAGSIALGAWLGHRLTAKHPAPPHFERNAAAVTALGLSPREVELLEALASGESNKELARRLGISPNTVKTHLARTYEKLGVNRRVQALEKARFLSLIP